MDAGTVVGGEVRCEVSGVSEFILIYSGASYALEEKARERSFEGCSSRKKTWYFCFLRADDELSWIE